MCIPNHKTRMPYIVKSWNYLPALRLGNLRACCLPLMWWPCLNIIPTKADSTTMCSLNLQKLPNSTAPPVNKIKPHAPLLVVPFRQLLLVSAMRPYSPRSRTTLICQKVLKELPNSKFRCIAGMEQTQHLFPPTRQLLWLSMLRFVCHGHRVVFACRPPPHKAGGRSNI